MSRKKGRQKIMKRVSRILVLAATLTSAGAAVADGTYITDKDGWVWYCEKEKCSRTSVQKKPPASDD